MRNWCISRTALADGAIDGGGITPAVKAAARAGSTILAKFTRCMPQAQQQAETREQGLCFAGVHVCHGPLPVLAGGTTDAQSSDWRKPQ